MFFDRKMFRVLRVCQVLRSKKVCFAEGSW